MRLADLPEAARPAQEKPIALHEACARWPDAFATCLKQLEGFAALHASTGMHAGQPHLFVWAMSPRFPGMELAGTALLPPDMAQVRDIVRAIT